MRKLLSLLLVGWLLLGMAAAEDRTLAVESSVEVIRPGKALIISFTAPEAGHAALRLENESGEEISPVAPDVEAAQGLNQIWWNGTYLGVPAPQGEAWLTLEMGGESARTRVTVGAMAPYLTNLRLESEVVTPLQPLTLAYYAGCAGRLITGLLEEDTWVQLASWQIAEGENQLTWEPVDEKDGDVVFTIRLVDETGFSSNEEHLTVRLQGFDAPLGDENGSIAQLWQESVRHWTGEDDEEESVLPPEDDDLVVIEDTVLVVPEQGVQAEHGAEVISQRDFTPSYGSPYALTDADRDTYWGTPMDITDEAAIWRVLTAPVTTVYNGSTATDTQKQQIVIRSEPRNDSVGVGVVTNLTQSVRVLERGSEWTLIECYSSSFHDSKVLAWNMLVQGYVPTKYLRTVTPNQHLGYVVDKLTQRLYVFKDGELYDTLLCGTGQANKDQPYNETRSGEFLLQTPAMGGFKSDNLICDYGIRFNGGDVLHEVPHVLNADGSNNYKTTEPKLGTKSSHGCIRVQRLKTPKGTNMLWIWNNRKDETKILVWEDWQGRQIAYPQDDLALYYNPKGGSYYHTAETCYSAKNKVFTPFTYGELDTGSFAKLTRCPNCAPPLRKKEIDEINALYAPGGDHDPILTAARDKFLAQQEKLLSQ